MIYPCKKCSHDTGKCRCLDWQRWFSVEFEAEAAKVLAATHAEPLPAPPKIFYRKIVFSSIFTRLWR